MVQNTLFAPKWQKIFYKSVIKDGGVERWRDKSYGKITAINILSMAILMVFNPFYSLRVTKGFGLNDAVQRF